MIYSLVIEPRALLDIQDAIDFYDSKSAGLGAIFFQKLEHHFETIAKNPHFQIRYKDYLALPIRKFPYIIFYFIEEKTKTVFVISVFNTYLNPTRYPK